MLRLGTRGSTLALAQAGWVAERMGTGVEVVTITTQGDVDRAAPDKVKWVRELDAALIRGDIDAAVHSAKDVPAELPEGIAVAAIPAREDPRDALCGTLSGRVGTASLRREAMLHASDETLDVVELRGNVDTRLRALSDGVVDGLVLALAGLRRLGRAAAADRVLDELVPAAGQGALIVTTRTGEEARAAALLAPEDDAAVRCERAAVHALGADCHSALGVHHDGTRLRAWLGLPDGSAWLSDTLDGPPSDALGQRLAERLLAAGAADLLHGGAA